MKLTLCRRQGKLPEKCEGPCEDRSLCLVARVKALNILLKRLCKESCSRCAVTAAKCNVEPGACEIAEIKKGMRE